MATPRSTGKATVSFGLVSFTVKLYVAHESAERVEFRQLHKGCGSRMGIQPWCLEEQKPVERAEIVKGFEFAKGEYAVFTEEELAALKEDASHALAVAEFVPLALVDPVYYGEKAYSLTPDKGNERPYTVLAHCMRERKVGAIARYGSHGKARLMMLRASSTCIMMHELHYAAEVRSIAVATPAATASELELGLQLVDLCTSPAFTPEKYTDARKERFEAVLQAKLAGKAFEEGRPEAPRAQIIDLVAALKASLEQGVAV